MHTCIHTYVHTYIHVSQLFEAYETSVCFGAQNANSMVMLVQDYLCPSDNMLLTTIASETCGLDALRSDHVHI